MKNSISVATTLHPLTPAQAKLVDLFNHLEIPERIPFMQIAFEWSFYVDFHLEEDDKTAQYTMNKLIKILYEINEEKQDTNFNTTFSLN